MPYAPEHSQKPKQNHGFSATFKIAVRKLNGYPFFILLFALKSDFFLRARSQPAVSVHSRLYNCKCNCKLQEESQFSMHLFSLQPSVVTNREEIINGNMQKLISPVRGSYSSGNCDFHLYNFPLQERSDFKKIGVCLLYPCQQAASPLLLAVHYICIPRLKSHKLLENAFTEEHLIVCPTRSRELQSTYALHTASRPSLLNLFLEPRTAYYHIYYGTLLLGASICQIKMRDWGVEVIIIIVIYKSISRTKTLLCI